MSPHRIQPIAVRDVLHYLSALAHLPAGLDPQLDIAALDVHHAIRRDDAVSYARITDCVTAALIVPSPS
ncbi:hypothetical protein GCM10020229_57960 [Kitasatospora albolonga]|uniref:hypothetical protein n=1 Tax=Kitasatospora albolonga TaxID=68173 RepID=UPI0031EE9355